MRRIVKSGASLKSSLKVSLAELGSEYRAFKLENPGRAARLPSSFKEKAKGLHQAGVDLQDLAKATGLQPQSIKLWLDLKDDRPKRAYNKRKKELTTTIEEESPVVSTPALAEAGFDLSTQQGSSELTTQEIQIPGRRGEASPWVKLRISGREIEIASSDLSHLLALAPEAAPVLSALSTDMEAASLVGDARSYSQMMAEYERVLISNAVAKYGSVAAVAKVFNMSRSTLDAKRRKLGLV